MKPSLWADEKLTSCSLQARLTFVGLLTESDDEGRQLYSGARIAGALYPLDGFPPKKVMSWVRELETESIVHSYEVSGGSYLCIPNFKEHQVISHPGRSTYPVCPTHGVLPEPLRKSSGDPPETLRSPSGNPPETLRPEVGSGSRKGKGKGSKSFRASAEGDALVELFCSLLDANGVRHPTPPSLTWRNEARLLLEIDNRDKDEAAELMRWCQADPFWHMNILSVPKFRRQYDQLRLKAEAPRLERPVGEIEQWLGQVEEVERGRSNGSADGGGSRRSVSGAQGGEAASRVVVRGVFASGAERGN